MRSLAKAARCYHWVVQRSLSCPVQIVVSRDPHAPDAARVPQTQHTERIEPRTYVTFLFSVFLPYRERHCFGFVMRMYRVLLGTREMQMFAVFNYGRKTHPQHSVCVSR